LDVNNGEYLPLIQHNVVRCCIFLTLLLRERASNIKKSFTVKEDAVVGAPEHRLVLGRLYKLNIQIGLFFVQFLQNDKISPVA